MLEWAVFSIFRRNVLPSSSGLKCVVRKRCTVSFVLRPRLTIVLEGWGTPGLTFTIRHGDGIIILKCRACWIVTEN